jgi:4-amino-4-deoxy-L-arabinose transferase-like glycosyltransferase
MHAVLVPCTIDPSQESKSISSMFGGSGRNWLPQVVVVVALFFAALAPTLGWPEISGDSEVILAQTVLQMRHGGPWWIPMLGDQPRTKKPPLPAWITALFVQPVTVGRLSSLQAAVREAAYRELAFEMRIPALLGACLALLATGWTAEMIGGRAYALPSVLICGTLFLFLRFIRLATSDVYLLAWVAVANAFFAASLFRGHHWAGLIGGGVASGLALMSKGPPALAQTVMPVLLFVLARRMRRRHEPIGSLVLPSCAGLAAMLAVALPWPLYVYMHRPAEVATWAYELRGGGSAEISRDRWWSYITLLPNLMPWVAMCFVGNYLAALRWRRLSRICLALMLLWVPVLVLSFFPLRKDRYLLPMAGPAAILTAHAWVRMRRTVPRFRAVESVVWLVHWLSVSVIVGGVLVAGAVFLRRIDGTGWFSIPLAGLMLVVCLASIVLGSRPAVRYTPLPLLVTAACMLVGTAAFLYGWSASTAGTSEMKPVAEILRTAFPDRTVVYFDPPPYKKPQTLDLDIYLDRPVPVVDKTPPNDGSVAAVVMLRREGAMVPELSGWQYWADMTTAKHHYHWYLLVPAVAIKPR